MVKRKEGGGKGGKGKGIANGVGGGGGRFRGPITTPETMHPLTNQLEFIRTDVIKALFRHKASVLFKEPLDPVRMNLPTYYDFVSTPMDLGSIRERLNQGFYEKAAECLDDFQTMFSNCYFYNSPETSTVQLARDLELTLIRKLGEMPRVEKALVDEGQRSRRNSDASTERSEEESDQADGRGSVNGSESPAVSDHTGSGEDGAGRKSLRLRQVMTRPPTHRFSAVGVGAQFRSPQPIIDSEDSAASADDGSGGSASEEEGSGGNASCEEESDESSDESGNEHGGGTRTKDARVPATDAVVLINMMKNRRKEQMLQIQRQLDFLNAQMDTLQKQEKEDSLIIKGMEKITGQSLSELPTSTNFQIKKRAKPKRARANKAVASTLTKRASKKRRKTNSLNGSADEAANGTLDITPVAANKKRKTSKKDMSSCENSPSGASTGSRSTTSTTPLVRAAVAWIPPPPQDNKEDDMEDKEEEDIQLVDLEGKEEEDSVITFHACLSPEGSPPPPVIGERPSRATSDVRSLTTPCHSTPLGKEDPTVCNGEAGGDDINGSDDEVSMNNGHAEGSDDDDDNLDVY